MFDMDGDHTHVYDNKCYDKIDLRFCKMLLAVHRKSINTVVRGELGRYSIFLHILKQVLKYWMRMSRGNGNPVLHACYLENIDLVNNNKACFLGKIKNIVLNKLGFSES